MRLIKMLGLSAVAALAAMAFIGASSASAIPIDICLWNLPGEPKALTKAECDKVGGTIHSGKEKVKFMSHAVNPTLTGTVEEICEKSDATGYVVAGAESGEAESVVVESLTFEGNCKPCKKVVSNGLPYKGKFVMNAGGGYEAVSSGEATLSEGCPFGVECKFGSKNVTLELVENAKMDSHELVANDTLERTGGSFLCGSGGTWSAKYVTTLLPLGEQGELTHWFPFLLP